jgi:hypothetical protein
MRMLIWLDIQGDLIRGPGKAQAEDKTERLPH